MQRYFAATTHEQQDRTVAPAIEKKALPKLFSQYLPEEHTHAGIPAFLAVQY
jgi:hypothetical protein